MYMYQQLMKNESINLKESKEGYMTGLEGTKGKGGMIQYV